MLKKILAVVVLISVIITGFAGCEGKSPQTETSADYKPETKQEITAENMAAELDRLEHEIDLDISSEQ